MSLSAVQNTAQVKQNIQSRAIAFKNQQLESNERNDNLKRNAIIVGGGTAAGAGLGALVGNFIEKPVLIAKNLTEENVKNIEEAVAGKSDKQKADAQSVRNVFNEMKDKSSKHIASKTQELQENVGKGTKAVKEASNKILSELNKIRKDAVKSDAMPKVKQIGLFAGIGAGVALLASGAYAMISHSSKAQNEEENQQQEQAVEVFPPAESTVPSETQAALQAFAVPETKEA